MFYDGIVDKKLNFGKWQVRVSLGNNNTTFFWYNHDPSEEEVIESTNFYISQITAPGLSTKSQKLKEAENRYILFCRSLGLPDKASSTDIDLFCSSMKEQGNPLLAMEIAIRSLALINDVVQNDGKWSEIEFHDDIN